jgi:hypothetical protein
MKAPASLLRAVVTLLLPVSSLVAAVALPQTSSSDSIIPRAVNGNEAYERCMAPEPNQLMGHKTNHLGIEAYTKTITWDISRIRKITISHSLARIWKIMIEYQDGKLESFGSTDWGGGKGAVEESWRLLTGNNSSH